MIDRLGDKMNELGEDADMVNGTKEGRRFRHTQSEDSDRDDEYSADLDADDSDFEETDSDEETPFDQDALFESERGDPKAGEDSEVPQRPRLEFSDVVQTRRSWRRRRDQTGGDADLSASIDEGWQPRWMLLMIVAAFCVGLGSLLILESAQNKDDEVPAETEIVPPSVGTCYGTDSFGSALVIACSAAHTYQIVATYEFAGDVAANSELMLIDARLRCLDVFSAASSTGMPPDAEMIAKVPSNFDLQNDNRTVVCEIHARGNTILTGSLL